MTQIGTAIYLTPSDAAMSRDQLDAWLTVRGVEAGSDYLAELLEQYAGCTESQMDDVYSAIHAC